MCGRLGLYASSAELSEAFGVAPDALPELAPRYNIAPTEATLAIGEGPRGRTGQLLRWGLVRSHAKSPRETRILARRESLRRIWRRELVAHRCLVAASGFYEWRAAEAGGPKTPFWIARADARPLGLAAIYSTWHPPAGGGEPITGFAIVTRPAEGALRRIHDRMPVELSAQSYAAWLDPEQRDLDALCHLLDAPSPAAALAAHAVSTAVNRAGNDGPELIRPAPLSGATA